MQPKSTLQDLRILIAVLCAFLLAPGNPGMYAQPVAQDAASQGQEAPKIPNEQLDSLVAPIALYPDPLLAQVLAASTYPLEIIQLQQWLAQNKDLKDKALADAVQKQDWDPSIQGLAALPDVVKRLADDIKWTTDLGNAFLAQQSDVMDAVQRMRAKAQGQGNLKSNEQVKVETQVVETKQVIVVQQANPQVVYVPSYNPVVVYGPPIYPYPPIYYPPPGYYAAGMAISFGVGVAMGAMWSGGWGYNCGWHGSNNNITINNNNNFNRNSNINTGNRPTNQPANRPGGGSSNWQHNAQHRGGTPYSSRATASQYGGTARGDSMATRQANARQNQGRAGGGQPSTMNRGGAGGAGASNRAGGGAGSGLGGGNRGSAGGAQPSTMNRGGAGGGAGGGDRVGNRSVPSGGGAGGGGSRGGASAFGGASGGSGGAAKASSQRGASSMGASRGGGGGGGRRR